MEAERSEGDARALSAAVANAEVAEGGIIPVTAGDAGADRCAALEALAQLVKLLGNIDWRRARSDTEVWADAEGTVGKPTILSGTTTSDGNGDRALPVAATLMEALESEGVDAADDSGKSDTTAVELARGVTGSESSTPTTRLGGNTNVNDDGAVASRDG
jgi:hypothetical protein